jgi:hypothetical protein
MQVEHYPVQLRAGTILGLQSTHGNTFVTRLLRQAAGHEPLLSDRRMPSFIQSKLHHKPEITAAEIPAPRLQTKPDDTAADASFETLWKQYRAETAKQYTNPTAYSVKNALKLAAALIRNMRVEHINQGGELAKWLLDEGHTALAQEAVKKLEGIYWVEFTTDKKELSKDKKDKKDDKEASKLPSSGTLFFGADDLLNHGKKAIESGDHETGQFLLAQAYQLLQMELITTSESRFENLKNLSNQVKSGSDAEKSAIEQAMPIGRGFANRESGRILEQIREIVSVYAVQERQAVAAGKTKEAEQLAKRGREFRQKLQDTFTLAEQVDIEGQDPRGAISMEASATTDKKRGQGFTLHGVNGAEEMVTELPGAPFDENAYEKNAYFMSMPEMLQAVGGQEDLLTELLSHPEIRNAFKTGKIDLNDPDQRQRVWSIMYGIYEKKPSAGCGSALCALLRLVERYLKHFTRHTFYNIRDIGVNYLDSTMPQDTIGRLHQDCGVYAITVAYDVFQAVKAASLPVDFQIYRTFEHAMLAIMDTGKKEHYVVNNDKIIGPNSGDPIESIAKAYGETIGLRHAVSAAERLRKLSSSMKKDDFKKQIWEGYKQSGLGLNPQPTGPDDKRTPDERREDAYKEYYKDMKEYDRLSAIAHKRIDGLVESLKKKSSQDQQKLMQASIDEVTALGAKTAQIVINFIPHPDPARLKKLGSETLAIVASGDGQAQPAFVRAAKALLFLEKLGVKPTPEQQQFIDWVQNNSADPIKAYRDQGMPPVF